MKLHQKLVGWLLNEFLPQVKQFNINIQYYAINPQKNLIIEKYPKDEATVFKNIGIVKILLHNL